MRFRNFCCTPPTRPRHNRAFGFRPELQCTAVAVPSEAVYMSAYISARDALSKGSRKSRRAAQSQSSATGPAPFGDSGLTFVAAAVVAEAGARGFGAPCAKYVQSQSQAAMPTANPAAPLVLRWPVPSFDSRWRRAQRPGVHRRLAALTWPSPPPWETPSPSRQAPIFIFSKPS